MAFQSPLSTRITQPFARAQTTTQCANVQAQDVPPLQLDAAASTALYDRKNALCLAPRQTPLDAALRAPRCLRTEVSRAEAAALFLEASQMTMVRTDGRVAPVPYTYPIDGCYARAHSMAQRFAALGVSVRKVFAEGDLVVPSPLAGDAPATAPSIVRWGWHVAPTINVRDAFGVRPMVIDPSLASEPITIDAWNKLMGGTATITQASANAYWPSDLRRAVSPATSAAAHASVHTRITEYTTLAPVHELAAAVRRALAGSLSTCTHRVEQAKALVLAESTAVQAAFFREFPALAQLLSCTS